MSEIPADVYTLHLDHGQSADRPHGQNVSSHRRAIGHDAPIFSVIHECRRHTCCGIGKRIERDEAHAGGKRLHNTTHHACQHAHQPHIANMSAAPFRQLHEEARLGHHTHSEEDAHDVENHLNDAILQDLRFAMVDLVGIHQMTVDEFVHHPEHRQHAQRPKERTELGDVVECGDEPQSTNAHKEHQQSLPDGKAGVVAAIRHHNPVGIATLRKHTSDEPDGDAPRHQARQQHQHREVRGRHGSHVPQHQSCRVANNGKRSTTVGRYHDGRTENHALAATLYDAMHHDQHHECRGEVVEVCRDEERDGSQTPEHALAVAGLQQLAKEVEAAVVAQNLYNRHRSQQEQHNL